MDSLKSKKLNAEEFNKTLKIIYNGYPTKTPESVQKAIDKCWEEIKTKNKDIFRGSFFNIETIKETDQELIITYSSSDYAHYKATRLCVPELYEYPCTAIFGAVMLKTNDDYLVLAQLASWTSNGSLLQFIGGGFSFDDLKEDNNLDISDNMMRETEEEIGLIIPKNKFDNAPKYLIKIYENDDKYSMLLAHKVEIDLSKQEMQNQLEEHNTAVIESKREEKPEIDKLFFIKDSQKSLQEFLNNNTFPISDFTVEALKISVCKNLL